MSYSSVMPIHVPLVPCIPLMSHSCIAPRSSFSCRICRKRVRQPLMHRARIRGARPHPAPRMHPFFISSLIMSKFLRRDLLPALITRASSLGPPRFETLSSRVVVRRGLEVHRLHRVDGALEQVEQARERERMCARPRKNIHFWCVFFPKINRTIHRNVNQERKRLYTRDSSQHSRSTGLSGLQPRT